MTGQTWNLPWPELRIPVYQPITVGAWRLAKFLTVPQVGYFHSPKIVCDPLPIDQYVLLTPDDTWMSTARHEIESQAPHVAAARGHVAVMGAGLGVALYNILPKPEVTHVTLIERDPRVIDLLRQAANFEEWDGSEKLNVQITDAFDYRPARAVDHLYVDIWAKPGDPQALPDTQKIQARMQAQSVGWWTQEIHFLRWLARQGYANALTLERYRAWAKEIELPLIEQDNPAYLAHIPMVASSPLYQMVCQPERQAKEELRCERT